MSAAPINTAPISAALVSASRLSERSLNDSQAPLGYATTRVLDRMLASCGCLPGGRVTFAVEDELFAELKTQGIAILTYHKFPDEAWPVTEFSAHTVRLHTGEIVTRELAERGTRLKNDLWIREVRGRGADGHQTSILTTNQQLDLPDVAARIAAQWCQENYLKYMIGNFGLDRIIEHGTAALPDATVVVNPAHRRLEADLRRHRAIILRHQARLGALTLPIEATAEENAAHLTRGGELREMIAAETSRLEARKAQRVDTPKKITLKERPDYTAQTLTVELHRCGSALQDATIAQLCATRTDTETTFPTTNLHLIYRQVVSP